MLLSGAGLLPLSQPMVVSLRHKLRLDINFMFTKFVKSAFIQFWFVGFKLRTYMP